ncbi:MAG: hypothetical protein HY304_06685, partial [candidate division Zixibacteria bacterium]|nr:hypothetical protein [candidate division Zixibacteria bacterium]
MPISINMDGWMRQSGRTILVALAVGILCEGAAARATDRYRPDVLIIKLKPQAAKTAGLAGTVTRTGVRSLDELNVRLDIRGFRRIIPAAKLARTQKDVAGLGRYYIVQLAPGTNLDSARAAYAADANVEVAEPDYIEPMDMVPNDPDYAMQWTHSTSTDMDIDTQEAWDLEV